MWVAITVRSDAEWANLCAMMDKPELAMDARFGDVISRRHHQDELDGIITEWTQPQDAYEVMHKLQKSGVPAGVAQKGNQILEDPHFASRGFWEVVSAPEAGTHPYLSRPFKHSKTPGSSRMHAPLLGQHTEQVLRDIGGFSEEEIKELAELGITSNIPPGAREDAFTD